MVDNASYTHICDFVYFIITFYHSCATNLAGSEFIAWGALFSSPNSQGSIFDRAMRQRIFPSWLLTLAISFKLMMVVSQVAFKRYENAQKHRRGNRRQRKTCSNDFDILGQFCCCQCNKQEPKRATAVAATNGRAVELGQRCFCCHR